MNMFSFAGAQGALDRNAVQRRDAAAQDQFWAQGWVMPVWRGKVGFDAGNAALLWVPSNHPALAHAGTRLYLGQSADRALFAVDISGWQPDQVGQTAPTFLDTSVQDHPDLPDGVGFADLRSVMTLLSPLDGECSATAKALLSWHDSHGFCARCGAQSQIVDAGWQRTCPACQTSHFPRTDPVVIMLVTRGDRLLLGRSPEWPEGMYSLLAGFVEPGETIEAAVRREVFEETGVRVGAVRYLASQPWPFPASLMLGALAQAQSTQITLDTAELQDALWLTRQEVLQVQLGRNLGVKAGRKGAIAQFLIQEWLSGRID
jgi:NAD+ diphosphatase